MLCVQPEEVEKLINFHTSEFCTNAAFKRLFHVRIQTTMFTVAKSMQTVSWAIVLEVQHPETEIYFLFIKVMRCSSLSSVQNRVISTSKPDLIIVHDTISWLEHSWDRPVHTAATVPQKFWNDFILSQIFDYISTEGAGRLPTVKEAAAEEEGDTKGNQLFLICDLLQHMMMLSYLFSLCYYNMTPPWCWNQKSGGC